MKQLVILFMMLSLTAFSQKKTNDNPHFSYKTLTKISSIVYTENGAFCYIYYGEDLKGPYAIVNPSEVSKTATSMYVLTTASGYQFNECRYFIVGELKDNYYDLWPDGNRHKAIRIHSKCFFKYNDKVTGTIW